MLERLGRDGDGLVAPQLKHPFRDGATEFLCEQLDFLSWLVALKPRTRGHLRRHHGVLDPNLRHRRLVVSAALPTPPGQDGESTPAHARAPMSSMQRPRYVFDIDRHQYPRCGAALRVLAVIADPPVIATMLEHIDTRAAHRFFPLTPRTAPLSIAPPSLPRARSGILSADQSAPRRPVSRHPHLVSATDDTARTDDHHPSLTTRIPTFEILRTADDMGLWSSYPPADTR